MSSGGTPVGEIAARRVVVTAVSLTAGRSVGQSMVGQSPIGSGRQSKWRVEPQTGQIARPRSGYSSRKLVQPLVRQYSRVAIDRRRRRRIEAERPLMDDWWVRESMCSLVFLAAVPGGMGPGSAVVWLVAGGASERNLVACWTRERVEPFRCSVDAQTRCPFSAFTSYALEDGVSPPACQIVGIGRGEVIGAESALWLRRRSSRRSRLGGCVQAAAGALPFTTVNRA